MESSVLQQDIAKLIESFPFVEEFKGKTFIVTGATGLIGSIVVKTLLALNKCFHLSLRVVAVIRNDQKAKEVLGWIPQHDLMDCIKSAYEWEKVSQ